MVHAVDMSNKTITVENDRQVGEAVKEFAAGLPIIWGTGYPVEKPHVLCTQHWGVWWARKFPNGDTGLSSCQPSDSIDILIRPAGALIVEA